MRRLVALPVLLMPLSLGAQLTPSVEVGAGATFPVGDLDRSYDVGVHVRAGVALGLAGSSFALRVEGELHTLPETFVDGRSTLPAAALSLQRELVAFGPTPAGGTVGLLGGVGYYALDTSVGGAEGDPGVQAGVVVSRRLLAVAARTEARLVQVFASPRRYRLLSLTVGLRF